MPLLVQTVALCVQHTNSYKIDVCVLMSRDSVKISDSKYDTSVILCIISLIYENHENICESCLKFMGFFVCFLNGSDILLFGFLGQRKVWFTLLGSREKNNCAIG